MGSERKVVDRVSEVNILTVTRLRWWPFQLLGFFVARRSQWAAEHLIRQSGLVLNLKRLNFLHAGRWVALGRFPKAGLRWRQRESPRQRWVLFVANFNQTWRPYFFAFLDSFGSGVDTLWGESDGMPDYPLPSTRYETIEWIERQLPVSSYYFAAYPEVSTNEVRCAVRVAREVTAYERAIGAKVELRYRELPESLQRSLQPCLIPIESTPYRRNGLPLPLASAAYDGNVGLVACFPLEPSKVGTVQQYLSSRNGGKPDSLFAHVPGVHFARLFVIDRHGLTPSPPLGLKNSWLVLSVVFDATVARINAARRHPQVPQLPDGVIEEFARRAHRTLGEEVDELWGCCIGRRVPIDENTFAQLVRAGTVRNLLVFHDYPDVTLSDIFSALRRHRLLLASVTAPIPAI